MPHALFPRLTTSSLIKRRVNTLLAVPSLSRLLYPPAPTSSTAPSLSPRNLQRSQPLFFPIQFAHGGLRTTCSSLSILCCSLPLFSSSFFLLVLLSRFISPSASQQLSLGSLRDEGKMSARSRQHSGSARAPTQSAVRAGDCWWSAWVEKEEEVVVVAGERRGGGGEVRRSGQLEVQPEWGAGGGSEVEVRNAAACVRVTDLTPLPLPLKSHFTRRSQSRNWGPHHLPMLSSQLSQLNYTTKKKNVSGVPWSKLTRCLIQWKKARYSR